MSARTAFSQDSNKQVGAQRKTQNNFHLCVHVCDSNMYVGTVRVCLCVFMLFS